MRKKRIKPVLFASYSLIFASNRISRRTLLISSPNVHQHTLTLSSPDTCRAFFGNYNGKLAVFRQRRLRYKRYDVICMGYSIGDIKAIPTDATGVVVPLMFLYPVLFFPFPPFPCSSSHSYKPHPSSTCPTSPSCLKNTYVIPSPPKPPRCLYCIFITCKHSSPAAARCLQLPLPCKPYPPPNLSLLNLPTPQIAYKSLVPLNSTHHPHWLLPNPSKSYQLPTLPIPLPHPCKPYPPPTLSPTPSSL
jgi:hypothetical protein